MKIQLNNATTITFVLILTIATFTSILPGVLAQTKKETAAFLNVNPELVGIGQSILVNAWVSPMPPLKPMSSSGEPRTGYYYDITTPTGTETVGPHTSDGPGSDWFIYTPNQIGTYTIQFRWAGDELFEAVESQEVTFVVQTEQIGTWPAAPLPDGYWTRPISAANREWYALGGGWRQSTGRDTPNFNPYSQAPDSAHILWEVQTRMGGLIGGETGNRAYQSTAASKVIMMGRVYFSTSDGTHCIDIHTGEELWNPPVSTSGSLFALQGPTPYLWGMSSNAFRRYNAETGALQKTVTGQPSGSALFEQFGANNWRRNRQWMSPEGILYINVDDRFELFGGLVVYDTTVSSSDYYAGVLWCIERTQMNGTNVALYNYPYGNSTGVIVEEYDMPIQDLANMAIDEEEGIIFCSSNGGNSAAAFDMTTGELLWNIPDTGVIIIEGQSAALDGVGACGTTDGMSILGYDLSEGTQIWESEPGDYPWGGFRAYSSGAAYGKFYFLSYDGTVTAYNADDGSTAWRYYGGDDIYAETPYGQYPFYQNPAIADGKIYATTYEHSPSLPLKRGDGLYCISDETGDLLWKIMGCNSHLAIADGVLVASDTYMPMMYGFDKGQTKTTVTVSPKIIADGSIVLIEGSVMDLSPAQPNTPAISDEDMSAWMEYLHMQQPLPTDLTGVEVGLWTLDPNNNYYEIGTVTSDAAGMYSLMWEPEVEGHYTIIARFDGSNSYYSSYSETFVGVTKAASAAQPIEPEVTTELTSPEPTELTSPEPTEPTTPFITTEIAIIAAVAVASVIGAVSFWALRKRK